MSNAMDYNAQVDIEASLVVFERSNPTLVPLSVTVETSLRRAQLSQIRKSGALGELIASQAEAFARDEATPPHKRKAWPALPDDTINFQHDPLACAIALGWSEGVRTEAISLRFKIENGYLREIVDPTGKPTSVVTRVDGKAFSNFWVCAVSGILGTGRYERGVWSPADRGRRPTGKGRKSDV